MEKIIVAGWVNDQSGEMDLINSFDDETRPKCV
jgi:hypothetical protein